MWCSSIIGAVFIEPKKTGRTEGFASCGSKKLMLHEHMRQQGV